FTNDLVPKRVSGRKVIARLKKQNRNLRNPLSQQIEDDDVLGLKAACEARKRGLPARQHDIQHFRRRSSFQIFGIAHVSHIHSQDRFIGTPAPMRRVSAKRRARRTISPGSLDSSLPTSKNRSAAIVSNIARSRSDSTVPS